MNAKNRQRLPRRFARSIETLESRLCLSAIRVVSWNTANGPDNTTEDAYFRTVFSAIGAASTGGTSLPPSIVALQETDTAQFGGNSISRLESVLDSLYPSGDFRQAVSGLDTGNDANGFLYDSTLLELVSTRVVPRTSGMQAFAHNNFRARFRQIGASSTEDFYVYSVHLKAGSNSDDQSRRVNEAAAIRADIDALGANQEVLVVGDFNISGSNEGAYQAFLGSGNGQLFDPIDRPGQWKNNSAFKSIHTQNPAINGPGGMDDRFDFQLATADVLDTEDLRFVEGSYVAFGNNGTHTFNSDITTGTGASSAVLSALAAASDHLPVVADYELGDSLPKLVITPRGASTQVVEGGLGDVYEIALDRIPQFDVSVTISTDGETRVNGQSSTTIVFTPSNATIPQSITVSAVDDLEDEGAHVSQIVHETVSNDAEFDQLPPTTLLVNVVDNEQSAVVISEIMYNPATDESNGFGEWVEIVNLGPGDVNVSGWQLDDEDTLDWAPLPPCVVPLPPGGVVIVHNALIDSEVFRASWSIPETTKVIGVAWGSLANSPSSVSEVLELRDAGGGLLDRVNYDDDGTVWPADNGRSSIYLLDPNSDNDVGTNWELSQTGVDGAQSPSGATFRSADIGSPGYVPLSQVAPPQIVSVAINGNDAQDEQRSLVRSLTVHVDQPVLVNDASFQLHQIAFGSGASEPVDVDVQVASDPSGTEVTLTFAGDSVVPATGSLSDGRYVLRVVASETISAASGLTLDGDVDGQSGGDFIFGADDADRFFRLYGDSDGDGDVDGADLSQIGGRLLRRVGDVDFDESLDADGDGDIDGTDLRRFNQNYLTRV